MDDLFKWSLEGLLPNTLMTIYQKKFIDLELLRSEDDILVSEPLGELDLLWILSNMPKEYLRMKKIVFSTSYETFDFTVTDGENSVKIEMTNYHVEVER
jgi:hypothetical protein